MSPFPRSGGAEVEVISETRLEGSISRPAPRDVLTSNTTVESTEKVDKGEMSGSGMRKRKRCSACLALAMAAVEKAHVLNTERGALRN
jgi:hypothetical protein